MSDFIPAAMLDAALATVNAKRRAAGLPELVGFGAPGAVEEGGSSHIARPGSGPLPRPGKPDSSGFMDLPLPESREPLVGAGPCLPRTNPGSTPFETPASTSANDRSPAFLSPAKTLSVQQDLLEQGQALRMKRRVECGIDAPPPYRPPAPEPTLPEILERLKQECSPPAAFSGTSAPVAQHRSPNSPQPPPAIAVRVWTQLTLRASRGPWSGAIRVWILAQHLDPHGSGVVEHEALNELLERLVESRSTRCRWLREAETAGFLREVRGGHRYRLLATHKACKLVGVDEPGQRIEVDAHGLCQPGWKGLLWAGNLAGHSRPVSRAFLHQTTGVPRRTQREYDKAGQVTATANYAVDLQSDPGLGELSHSMV